MNRYFGEPWDAPFVKDAERVATPVDKICPLCEEPFVEGDQGIVTPVFHSDADGKLRSRLTAEHRGCMLLGVVGHVAGTCLCHDGLGSVRERGLATVAWMERNRI